MKLRVYIALYNPTADTDFVTIWYESMIWAITEHGLSLFAASILATRPFFTFISHTYGSFSSKLGYGSGSRKSVSARGTSSRVSKGSNWPGSPGSTELGRVAVRSDFDVRSEYDAEHGLGQSVSKVDASRGGESPQVLVRGISKVQSEVEADEVAH